MVGSAPFGHPGEFVKAYWVLAAHAFLLVTAGCGPDSRLEGPAQTEIINRASLERMLRIEEEKRREVRRDETRRAELS